MSKLSRSLSLLFLLCALVAQAEEPKIKNLLPNDLDPMRAAMASHWGFLYERAAPEFPDSDPKKASTKNRVELQKVATQRALKLLDQKGHVKGTGKALVMGGAYEVDLKEILEQFAQVDVVDLSEKPLELALRVYRDNPNFKKLNFFVADLSGISGSFQAQQLKVLLQDVKRSTEDHGMQFAFFKEMPKQMESIPFATGDYDFVVSPVLVESLAHAPLLAAFEAHRLNVKTDRKAIDEYLGGDAFYYQPEVIDAFARVFLHHSSEINRLLTKNGVAVFSVWRRDDLKKLKLAPQIEEPLFRVGDDRVTWGTWNSFFKPWSKSRYLGGEQIYGPEKAPTMHIYVLEK